MAKKVHRIIEQTAKAWCDTNGVVFQGYYKGNGKRGGKHDWLEILVLGEKVKVPVACTPGRGAETARGTVEKGLKRATRLKIHEIRSRPKPIYGMMPKK